MPEPDHLDVPDPMPKGRVRRPLVLSRPIWSRATWTRVGPTALLLVLIYWSADRFLIDGTPRIDGTVLDAIVRWRTGAAIDVSRVLTFLGDLWVLALIWAVLVTIARRQSGRWDLAWLVTMVVGGALLITGLVKDITDRARPEGALVEAASFAFPSGHAARVTAVWGLVGWLALRWASSALTRWAVWVIAAAMVLGTGLSRLVLGIHWPSDVLFGWILGAAWVTACILVVQPRHGTALAHTVMDEISGRLPVHRPDRGGDRGGIGGRDG